MLSCEQIETFLNLMMYQIWNYKSKPQAKVKKLDHYWSITWFSTIYNEKFNSAVTITFTSSQSQFFGRNMTYCFLWQPRSRGYNPKVGFFFIEQKIIWLKMTAAAANQRLFFIYKIFRSARVKELCIEPTRRKKWSFKPSRFQYLSKIEYLRWSEI